MIEVAEWELLPKREQKRYTLSPYTGQMIDNRGFRLHVQTCKAKGLELNDIDVEDRNPEPEKRTTQSAALLQFSKCFSALQELDWMDQAENAMINDGWTHRCTRCGRIYEF